MAKKKRAGSADEPQFNEGFDSGLLLGRLYTYLLSTRELIATLKASGIADSDSTPFGSLRVQLAYVSPVVMARCDELAATLAKQTGGKNAGGKVVAQGVVAGGDSS